MQTADSTSGRSAVAEQVRAIAYYLPQFHPIPENDAWWGKGFTEWTNVVKAVPSFRGHYQPRLPADLGFYDLRVPEVREQQAALAKSYGLHGFCYYYYWFAGKKLLERPVTEVLRTGVPDFPFCLCWANENWTRRWDGADREILISQNPSREDDLLLIRDLVPFFRDSRYIRVDGKPLFVVYRVGALPDVRTSAEIWREYCRREGVGEIYLCAAKTYDTDDPARYGFDAVVEFPPHQLRTVKLPDTLEATSGGFSSIVFDYRQFVADCIARPQPDYMLHHAVMPGWDNTPRRPNRAMLFLNSSPECYELWLREVVARTIRTRRPSQRLVFINAWNEWAEGAYLEPDRRFGHQYLEATRRALTEVNPDGELVTRLLLRRRSAALARST
jgi:lipopolysaccharide biosynthesis protein